MGHFIPVPVVSLVNLGFTLVSSTHSKGVVGGGGVSLASLTYVRIYLTGLQRLLEQNII